MDNKNVNTDIHGKAYSKGLLIIALMLGSFVSLLNQTLLATALPQIMNYFQITASTGQWLTTSFMLVNAIMIPLTALLLEKISTKKLYIFSMTAFAAGTVLCAFSPSFEVLLVGRMVQAVGAGILAPLVSTVLLLIFPPEKRGSAMGMYGLVICFAPAIGPTLSGLIIDLFSWHYLFYIIIPIAVIDIILSFFFMKDVVPQTNPRIDILSILLSCAGFGAMLYGFSSAGNLGWSNVEVILSIVAGVLTCVLFVWRQLTMEKPMLNLRVFQHGTFTLTTAIGCILNIAFAGAGIILPLFLQTIRGQSAFDSGLLLLPGALIMAVMTLISGRLFDRYGAKKLAIPGLILLVMSTIPFSFLHKDVPLIYLSVVYAIRYIGIAMAIMPLQTAGMNDLPKKLLSHGSAVVNTAKQLAGSLGAAVLITIMSNITASKAPDKALSQTDPARYGSEMIDASLNGVNKTFLFMIGLTAIALICSFFLKNKTSKTILRDVKGEERAA